MTGPSKRLLSYLLCFITASQPMMVSAAVVIDAAAAANHQATLNRAANGVAIVNIANPNSNGVSHNQFTQYDVEQTGLILNNSQQANNTQLGAWIDGNRNLSGGGARLILNEVTGSHRSHLLGFTEVAGQQADFVLANPNGISCNGCGFINTPRVTLATAVPLFSAGDLSALRVTGGDITIEGLGLNAAGVSQFELVTRSATLNANLYAQQLTLILGNNTVDYSDLTVTNVDQVATQAPEFSLDSSALGGMYANSIQLIGTEHGVGVRLRGDMAASADDIIMSSQGGIELANTAANHTLSLRAQGDIRFKDDVTAQNIDVTASHDVAIEQGALMSAESNLTVQSQQLTNRGFVQSAENLQWQVAGSADNTNGSVLANKLEVNANHINNNGGEILSATELTLNAVSLIDNNAGVIRHSGDNGFSVNSLGDINNQQGLIETNANVAALTAGTLNNSDGVLRHTGQVGLSLTLANNLNNHQGQLHSNGNMTIDVEGLDNRAGLIATGGTLSVQAAAIVNDNGLIDSVESVTINADSLRNDLGDIIAAGTADSSITVTGLFNNQRGSLQTNANNLTLQAANINNQAGYLLHAGQGQLRLNSSAAVNNVGGDVLSYGEAFIEANQDTLDNSSGSIRAVEITLLADDVVNNGGLIEADEVSIHAAGDLINGVDTNAVRGEITALSQSSNSLDLVVGNALHNTQGLIQTNSSNTTLTAKELNNSGAIQALGQLTVLADAIDNQAGSLSAEGDLSLQAAYAMNNSGGYVGTGASLTLEVQAGVLKTFNNTQGQFHSNANMTIDVGALDNSTGLISTGGMLSVQAAAIVNDNGLIDSVESVTINADSLRNDLGDIIAAGTAGSSITVTGLFNNQRGSLQTNANNLTLQAANINNQAGYLLHAGQGQLRLDSGAAVNNVGGDIVSYGEAFIEANQDTLDNSSGSIRAVEITLLADDVINNGGLIEADEVSIHTAGDLINGVDTHAVRGEITALSQSSNSLDLVIGNALHNTQGLIQTNSSNTTLTAKELNNSGAIQALGQLTVLADAIDNQAGSLSAEGDLSLQAVYAMNNSGGYIDTGASLALDVQAGDLNNQQGLIIVAGNGVTTLSADQGIDNRGGQLHSNSQTLTLESAAGEVNNSLNGSIIHSGSGDFTLSAHTLNNDSGSLLSAGHLQALGLNDLDNQQGYLLADRLSLNANRVNNTLGNIVAAGQQTHSVTVDTLINDQGKLYGAGDLTVAVNTLDNDQGLIQSEDNLTLNVIAMTLHEGEFNAGQTLTFNNQGDFVNAAHYQLVTSGDLQINTTGSLSNVGELSTTGDITLSGSALFNRTNAAVTAGNDLTMNFTGNSENDSNARLTAANDVSLSAVNFSNHGVVAAGQVLTTNLSANLNNHNTFFAGDSAYLYAQSQLNNHAGANIFAVNDIVMAANAQGAKNTRVRNESATIESYSGDITIATQLFENLDDVPAVTLSYKTLGGYHNTYRPQTDGSGISNDSSEGSVALSRELGYDVFKALRPDELYLFETYVPDSAWEHYWTTDSSNRITRIEVGANLTIESTDYSQQAPAKLIAGGNITIAGDDILNRVSLIAADGDITMTGNQLNNQALILTETAVGRWEVGREKKSGSKEYYDGGGAINSSVEIGRIASTIHAGGVFTANMAQHIGNGSDRDGLGVAAANNTNRTENTGANSKALTLINNGGVQAAVRQGNQAAVAVATPSVVSSQFNAKAVVNGLANNAEPPLVVGSQFSNEPVVYNPINGLQLPQNEGLFVLNTGADTHYLVETNPLFADYTQFIGSDYFMDQLGIDPGESTKRLGDAFYENRLIRDAVFKVTGQRYLINEETQQRIASDNEQMLYLMNNAISAQEDLQLSVGVSLSAEQVSLLARDIVWLEEHIIQGESVLVPVYYAVNLNDYDLDKGAVVSAETINLVGASINNRGLLSANDQLLLDSQQDLINQGALRSGGDMTLLSRRGSVLNEANVSSQTLTSGSTHWSQTVVTDTPSIEAGGRLTVVAAEDVRFRAANVEVGDNLSLRAGRDIGIVAAAEKEALFQNLLNHRESTTQIATTITAGGNAMVEAGRDVSLQASSLNAGGNVVVSSVRNMAISSLANTSRQESYSRGGGKKQHTINESVEQQSASLTAGNDLILQSGNNLTLSGSQVTAANDAVLTATNNLRIEGTQNETYDYLYKKKDGSMGRSRKTVEEERSVTNHASNINAGGNVSINAEQTLNPETGQLQVALNGSKNSSKSDSQQVALIGSRITAGGNAVIHGDAVNIEAGTESYSYRYEKKTSGVGGLSGSENQKQQIRESTIGASISAGNSVAIISESDTNVLASHIAADENITVQAGGDINVVAVEETESYMEQKTSSSMGGLNSDLKESGERNITQASSSMQANDITLIADGDIQLVASTVAAANDATLTAGQGEKGGDVIIRGAMDETATTQREESKRLKLSLDDDMLSVAETRTERDWDIKGSNVSSVVSAGNNVTVVATGEALIEGSVLVANNNVVVAADKGITVKAGLQYADQGHEESIRRTGIALEADGNGITAFAGNDKTVIEDSAQGEYNAASLIQAGQDISLQSGQDLSIAASDVMANRDVNLQAVGNVSIIAAQDKNTQRHQETWERDGLTLTMNHNFENTKEAIEGAGEGDNNTSKASSTLQAIDAIDRVATGPSFNGHMGKTTTVTEQVNTQQTARGSTIGAGRDINVLAGDTALVSGSGLLAGNQLLIAANDIDINVADNINTSHNQSSYRQVGTNMSANKNSAAVGAAYSTQSDSADSVQTTGTSSTLEADTIHLIAENDLAIIGSNLVANDIALQAGNDLRITAVQNQYSSEEEHERRSAQAGVKVTAGPDGVAMGANGQFGYGEGELNREGNTYTHSAITAKDSLTTVSKNDTIIEGATLEAGELTMTIGGNLHIASARDTGMVDGERKDVDVDMTAGAGVSVSGSLGYGETSGDKDWIEQQTTLTGKTVTINTQNHTQIDSALIAATDTGTADGKDNGQLSLTTGTLGTSDSQGHDEETSYYANISTSLGDHSNPQANSEGNSGGVEGSYYEKDRQQVVRATVGTGTITTRDEEADLNNINRDISKAYEITKDDEETTGLYVTSSSLGAVDGMVVTDEEANEGEQNTFVKWSDGFASYGEAETYLGILDNVQIATDPEEISAAWDQVKETMGWQSYHADAKELVQNLTENQKTILTAKLDEEQLQQLEANSLLVTVNEAGEVQTIVVDNQEIPLTDTALEQLIAATEYEISLADKLALNEQAVKESDEQFRQELDTAIDNAIMATVIANGEREDIYTGVLGTDLLAPYTVSDELVDVINTGADGLSIAVDTLGMGIPGMVVEVATGQDSPTTEMWNAVYGTGEDATGISANTLEWSVVGVTLVAQPVKGLAQLGEKGVRSLDEIIDDVDIDVGDWFDDGSMLGGSVVPGTDLSGQILQARQRQYSMLDDNVGFNISPTSWDEYPTIGLNGTFISDYKGITDIIGDFSGRSNITLEKSQVFQLENAFGLEKGALQEGFKIRQVDNIVDQMTRSPMEGNQYFLGPGNHLPGGAPEMVIDSIPTVDTSYVKTLLEVLVE